MQRAPNTSNRLRAWATSLKENTFALYLASRDPRVPLVAKLVAVIVVAYALSPIDLIPDFIPVIGYLDDLLLLPLGILLAIKLIPDNIWQDCRDRAAREILPDVPGGQAATVTIVTVWVLVAGYAGWIAWQWFKSL